jgi:hypothetical protein
MKKRLENILEKYELRKEECEEQFQDDATELSNYHDSSERIIWLNDDMRLLNAQISAYECIIKDLKEIIKSWE